MPGHQGQEATARRIFTERQAPQEPEGDEARVRRIFRERGNRPGRLEAFARGAVQGATFEFGDEISAGLRSLRAVLPGGETPGEAFRENVKEIRAKNEAAREAHPVISGLGTVGGAVGTTLATIGAGTALGLGAATAVKVGAGRLAAREAAKVSLRRLAAVGAVEGGVTGAGASEGGLIERGKGAAIGAGVGAVAAPLVTVGLRGAGAVGTRALDITGLRPSGKSTSIAGRAGRRLFDTVEDRAEQRLATSLPEGQALTEATDLLSGSSRPLTIMDIDENVAGVARASRGVQGKAKSELPKFLAERTAGQEARVLDDALRLTGAGERSSIFESTQEIITRRAERARPLYDAAYQRTVPRNVVGGVLDDDVFQKAYARGVRIARREGVTLPALADVSDDIPVQAIDYMKRGMDDLIEAGSRSAKGMGRQEARGIRKQLREMLERVDEAVPEYGEARAAFAGESRMLEALEEGQRLFQMEPAEARAIINEMTDSEREMFVRGGLEKLAEKVESASAGFDITKRAPLANRTRDKARLRLLFPNDEAFGEFQRGLADEARLAQTNRFVTGGSNTAEKLAEMAELAGVDVAGLMTGGVGRLAARAGASALRRRSQGFTGDLGEAMLPSLTATRSDATRVVEKLINLRQGVAAELSTRELVQAGVLGVVAGTSAGRARNDRP